MSEEQKYTVEFSIGELASLQECLAELRRRIDIDYQQAHFTQQVEPIHDPIFVAACKLHFKLDKVERPDTTVTLQDSVDLDLVFC